MDNARPDETAEKAPADAISGHLTDALVPPPYLRDLVAYLKTEEEELWNWFASGERRKEEIEATRLELLKSAYRLEKEANEELYRQAERVAAALALDAPITLYQSQQQVGLNASLVHLPGEIHLVLHGPLRERLTEIELEAVLGHEILHYGLLESWDGEYETARSLLLAMSQDREAGFAHIESLRLSQLHTEIYCDRGAFVATGDLLATISALLKTETDITDVNAESYLRQAEEIFEHVSTPTEQSSHPETFVRARALDVWSRWWNRTAENADPTEISDPHEAKESSEVEPPQGSEVVEQSIRTLLQPPLALNRLDLLGQKRLALLTRRLIRRFLRTNSLRSDLTMAHARLYFGDFTAEEAEGEDASLREAISTADEALTEYYSFVLMDFTAADTALEDLPLATALTIAEELGFDEPFRKLARRDLTIEKRRFDRVATAPEKVLAKDLAKNGPLKSGPVKSGGAGK